MFLFSVILLLIFAFLAYKASPREKHEDAHVHGAGQIGLMRRHAPHDIDADIKGAE